MRCYVSPITSSAVSVPDGGEPAALKRAEADPDAAVAQFEGMLFASALTPLSKELGVLGDVLTDAIGSAVARGRHDEFFTHLRALADASEKPLP
jgi:hypothetical protein